MADEAGDAFTCLDYPLERYSYRINKLVVLTILKALFVYTKEYT